MANERPDDHELMRMHVEALYRLDPRSRLTAVRYWSGGEAPRFFLGRTRLGNVSRFRADLAEPLIAQLERLAQSEPGDPADLAALLPEPGQRTHYLAALSAQAPIARIWAGPAYWAAPEALPQLSAQAVAIGEDNADLLHGGFESWLADVPHQRPFMAIVDDRQVVSVCASVRVTAAAHEAGVETLPARRRRGHARDAVAAWIHAVRSVGATPLYSTSWENSASRGVAAALGLSLFGVDFHVT
jgi:hypothetical protein